MKLGRGKGETQRCTIRKLAKALRVEPADLIEDEAVKLTQSFTKNLDDGVKLGRRKGES